MNDETPVSQELIPVKTINVQKLFTDKVEVEALLSKIKEKASEHEPDLSTPTTRKEIASNSYKVSQTKTWLVGVGKEYTASIKASVAKQLEKAEKSRLNCKFITEELDKLRDEKRKPLTDWEKSEAERKEKERLAEQFAQDWDAAHAEHDLFLRQKELERKEAMIAKAEADLEAKKKAERLEKERVENEKRIADEAAEKARRESEEKARIEKEKAERREREATEAAEKAEKERVAAVERAKIEKEMAIKAEQEKARQEAERVEQERLEKEASEKAEQERLARNKAHRRKINREALACLMENGFTEVVGKSIIELVATGKIKHIEIKYS